jgi:hypothetical protein
VHPFWLSHKEKWPWLRPSMGRQPWPELELHGRPWGARQRGEIGEKGERGGARGGPWAGRAARNAGAARAWLLLCGCSPVR